MLQAYVLVKSRLSIRKDGKDSTFCYTFWKMNRIPEPGEKFWSTELDPSDKKRRVQAVFVVTDTKAMRVLDLLEAVDAVDDMTFTCRQSIENMLVAALSHKRKI